MTRRPPDRLPARRPVAPTGPAAGASLGARGARSGSRGRGWSWLLEPGAVFRVTVVAALVGSLGYLAFAITVRDASQIPMLASGAAVLGVVFVVVALGAAIGAWQAGMVGRTGRAFANGAVGGIAAMIAAGCFAAAAVLALVWRA